MALFCAILDVGDPADTWTSNCIVPDQNRPRASHFRSGQNLWAVRGRGSLIDGFHPIRPGKWPTKSFMWPSGCGIPHGHAGLLPGMSLRTRGRRRSWDRFCVRAAAARPECRTTTLGTRGRANRFLHQAVAHVMADQHRDQVGPAHPGGMNEPRPFHARESGAHGEERHRTPVLTVLGLVAEGLSQNQVLGAVPGACPDQSGVGPDTPSNTSLCNRTGRAPNRGLTGGVK
jgi:hypothetical protein